METVTVVILEGGKTCREINPMGYKQPDWVIFRDSLGRKLRESGNIKANVKHRTIWQQAHHEAESKLRTWEIEYPEIKVGMCIWGKGRSGTPMPYLIIEEFRECDIECQIHLEDVDKEVAMLYLTGSTHQAQIINGKAVIV